MIYDHLDIIKEYTWLSGREATRFDVSRTSMLYTGLSVPKGGVVQDRMNYNFRFTEDFGVIWHRRC